MRDVIHAGSEPWMAKPGDGVQAGGRHSATLTHEWLAGQTGMSPWLSRLRRGGDILKAVSAAVEHDTLTPTTLQQATGIRASASDIESMLQCVENGVAVAQTLEVLHYRQLAARLRLPATTSGAAGAGRVPNAVAAREVPQ